VRSCLTELPIRPPAIRREGHGEFLRAADRELLRLEADLSDDPRAVAGSAPSCATRLHDGRRNRRFAGASQSSKVRRARGSRGPRATGRTGRARRLDRTARALVRHSLRELPRAESRGPFCGSLSAPRRTGGCVGQRDFAGFRLTVVGELTRSYGRDVGSPEATICRTSGGWVLPDPRSRVPHSMWHRPPCRSR
jgi:hypothetical protein